MSCAGCIARLSPYGLREGASLFACRCPPLLVRGPSPTGAWVVDPDWFGSVVVEIEGTNEGREDLQARCSKMTGRAGPDGEAEDSKTAWRILRERRSVIQLDDLALQVLIQLVVDLASYGSVRSAGKRGLSRHKWGGIHVAHRYSVPVVYVEIWVNSVVLEVIVVL